MNKTRTAFFIRAYNDLDHFSPIIWKFIIKGDRPIVIFHTDLDYKNDYRIKFLQSEGKLDIYQFVDIEYLKYQQSKRNILFKLSKIMYNLKRNPNKIYGKINRRLYFDCNEEIQFLKKNNVSQCVFEWGTPYNRGEIIEKFFKAAKTIGTTTFCIPHGCNIYLNSDVNTGYKNLSKRGLIADQSKRDEYDYYIIQNPIRRDGFVKWGLNPCKTQAWGSTRFYPDWQKINLKHCPPLTFSNNSEGCLKVVFMDHQKDYNVYVDKIWSLLNRIAQNIKIVLIIKSSTRAGKNYHSSSFRNKYKNSKHVKFVGNENHSPRLIEWSDCVINFGSSIGIEVLLQNKLLINPYYLHSNKTIFEKFNAALNAANEDEVVDYLQDINSGRSVIIPEENKELIFKEIFYGGNDAHDVLEKYYTNIKSEYLLY